MDAKVELFQSELMSIVGDYQHLTVGFLLVVLTGDHLR